MAELLFVLYNGRPVITPTSEGIDLTLMGEVGG